MEELQQPVEATPPATPSAEELEATLVALWTETLGVAQVGPDDNFFDLGGQSSLLLQVHTGLQARLGRDVPLMHLFQHPTVRSLAGRLARGDEADADAADETAQAARDRAAERREMRSRRRDPRRGR